MRAPDKTIHLAQRCTSDTILKSVSVGENKINKINPSTAKESMSCLEAVKS